MNKKDVQQRMTEIMVMIDQSITMTDDRNEILMLACAMMQRSKEIFESELGVEGRKEMFKDYV
jgi:hypothetical protein